LTFLQKLSKNKDEILYSNHFKEMSCLIFLYCWLIYLLTTFILTQAIWSKISLPKICWNCQNVGDSFKCWYF